MIHKESSEIAFFKYTRNAGGVPLAFDENSLQGLKLLQGRQDIHSEFYYYWNDMLNVTGYSAKLLLLFSALEALAKSPINQLDKYDFLSNVLGSELKDKLWRSKEGIRHRLTHGEYFNENSDKENYLNQTYEKVISYLNNKVFEENLIRNVTNPQRHPDNNKEGGNYFLKRINESPSFDLKNLVDECDKDINYLEKFEFPTDVNVWSKY